MKLTEDQKERIEAEVSAYAIESLRATREVPHPSFLDDRMQVIVQIVEEESEMDRVDGYFDPTGAAKALRHSAEEEPAIDVPGFGKVLARLEKVKPKRIEQLNFNISWTNKEQDYTKLITHYLALHQKLAELIEDRNERLGL